MKKMKQQDYVVLAQHIIDLGCPLDLCAGYRDTPAGLKFEQLPTLGTNQLFDLDGGGTGFVMDLWMSSELNLPMRIRQVQIETPWGLRDIELLPDPAKRIRTYQYYDFPASTLGFHRDVVVNDFLSGKCSLEPGGEVQGLLLAVDDGPIPDEYSDHGQAIVKVFIFDERGNRFASQFRLCVERSVAFTRDRLRKSLAASQSKHRLQKKAVVAA